MTNVKCQMIVCFRHILFKIIVPSLVIFNLSFLILSGSALALAPTPAWETYGKLINNTPGNSPQKNPQLITTSRDNFIVAWEDGRQGHNNIYMQKFSSSGATLWAHDGITIAQNPANQNFAQLVSDGADGAIVVWQDYRQGNADIFAQKITASGALAWGPKGLPLCTAAAGQLAPQLISDGLGGAIITWHDYRSGLGEDVYAQKINQQGNTEWTGNGVIVSAASGTQWYPQIASDGLGGAIITWSDGRSGSSNNNIYAQRIDPKGQTVWQKDGLVICSAAENQERPTILDVSSGAIITWNDLRSGNIDIYAQKIDVRGNLYWQNNGIEICTASYSQLDPVLASDGQGGAVVAWTDERVEDSDIYAQYIYHNGTLAWQENGRPLTKASGIQKNPQIVKSNNDWVVVWEDNRQEQLDLFAQKINPAGVLLWDTNGITVIQTIEKQQAPALVSARDGQVVAVWQDKRHGNFDIFAQKLGTNGQALWQKGGQALCQATGSVVQKNLQAIINQQGEVILAFEDARSGYFNIYLQKINRYGSLAWGQHGVPIARATADQINPQLISDNKGGAIVCWEDHRNIQNPAIRAQRINGSGQKVWPSSIYVAKNKSRQTTPFLIEGSNQSSLIAWYDNRNILSRQDIYIQKISHQGKLLWGKKGQIAISANGEQTDLDIRSDGTGGAILVFTDFRNSNRNPDIYAQKINSQGQQLWTNEGIQICGAPDTQHSPKVILDSNGGAIFVWTDKAGGSYDIYAQRVDDKGQTLWLTDGLPINQLGRTQQNPNVGTQNVIVWEDYRFGNWDIFVAAVNTSGKIVWETEGAPVAVMPHTQYSPQITNWHENALVAWEDYRSGKYYEIFIQQLDSNGKPVWLTNGVRVKSRDGGRAPKLLTDPLRNSFYVFWEDYSNGGRALYGQKFTL